MAKTVSEEEIQLRKRARRRLVGAITLVVTAVVILPMVLDDRKPEQRNQEIDIRIPSEDSVGELPPEAASLAQAPVPAVPAVPAKPAIGIEQEEQAESKSSARPLQPANEALEKPAGSGAESRVKPGSAEANVAADAANLFVVQLGAFSDPAKARQQLQSLNSKEIKKDTGVKAYTETLKVEKGEVTRVRLGSFGTREEAEVMREKLKKLGFEGVVTEK